MALLVTGVPWACCPLLYADSSSPIGFAAWPRLPIFREIRRVVLTPTHEYDFRQPGYLGADPGAPRATPSAHPAGPPAVFRFRICPGGFFNGILGGPFCKTALPRGFRGAGDAFWMGGGIVRDVGASTLVRPTSQPDSLYHRPACC